jgi:hypothetical protein
MWNSFLNWEFADWPCVSRIPVSRITHSQFQIPN